MILDLGRNFRKLIKRVGNPRMKVDRHMNLHIGSKGAVVFHLKKWFLFSYSLSFVPKCSMVLTMTLLWFSELIKLAAEFVFKLLFFSHFLINKYCSIALTFIFYKGFVSTLNTYIAIIVYVKNHNNYKNFYSDPKPHTLLHFGESFAVTIHILISIELEHNFDF